LPDQPQYNHKAPATFGGHDFQQGSRVQNHLTITPYQQRMNTKARALTSITKSTHNPTSNITSHRAHLKKTHHRNYTCRHSRKAHHTIVSAHPLAAPRTTTNTTTIILFTAWHTCGGNCLHCMHLHAVGRHRTRRKVANDNWFHMLRCCGTMDSRGCSGGWMQDRVCAAGWVWHCRY
jgi:hypothetical protein